MHLVLSTQNSVWLPCLHKYQKPQTLSLMVAETFFTTGLWTVGLWSACQAYIRGENYNILLPCRSCCKIAKHLLPCGSHLQAWIFFALKAKSEVLHPVSPTCPDGRNSEILLLSLPDSLQFRQVSWILCMGYATVVSLIQLDLLWHPAKLRYKDELLWHPRAKAFQKTLCPTLGANCYQESFLPLLRCGMTTCCVRLSPRGQSWVLALKKCSKHFITHNLTPFSRSMALCSFCAFNTYRHNGTDSSHPSKKK